MSLTSTQEQAIAARGNVLVVAGAGTGKTRTLVERCLACLLEETPPASFEEILMVTFTDAAAAEMRQRIRARLDEEQQRHPDNAHGQEQLALFETAHIGTLHSFCLQLVRQHFYQLELDPQLAVLPGEETRLLAEETLDGLFEKYYAGRGPEAEAVQELIQVQGRGIEKTIRGLVLHLHHYTQTLPDPSGWLEAQIAMFESAQPLQWREWFARALGDWSGHWLPALAELAPGNSVAAECLDALRAFAAANSPPERAAAALEAIEAAVRNCPRGKKTEFVTPLKEFVDDAQFLGSLAPRPDTASGAAEPAPLVQDWEWVRVQMSTLLQLAREFGESFGQAKHELGVVDFHDLEQFALRLLWDAKAEKPTPVAVEWRRRLRFVFVDEYQDINAAQDKIIEALSRDGAQANRFLVGDVKQSIYRFRLANPRIFQGYVESWREPSGLAIPLRDNFRSREGILDFVNSLFAAIMRREIGGVPYDELARLQFGAPEQRRPFSRSADAVPCVELHLRAKGNTGDAESDGPASDAMTSVLEMEEADREARLVGLRLREIRTQQQPIWDDQAKVFRAADWADMAILLRSPSNKAESYAKEFARLGIPLLVERGGFYQNIEILDLLSLLETLDNPLQDLPVLAVLHSPLAGLTIEELGVVRLAAAKTHFWVALRRWSELQSTKSEVRSPKSQVAGGEGGLSEKVSVFLERYGRWRRLARQVSLSHCLEAVLAETHYADWLLTQPRGEQRHANVRRLAALARQFDQFQRQGLFRFLRYIKAQQAADTEPEVGAVSQDNAVRLMSIHQSKGLEFPVVVAADLGKAFNLSDLRAEIILDEVYGLCPQIKPPHTGQRYPSLPYWLARQRQQRELLGEELRLLYVAMTRARDRLILSASISKKRLDALWEAASGIKTASLLAARSYSDWLALWFSTRAAPRKPGDTQGDCAGVRWVLHSDEELANPAAPPPDSTADAEKASMLSADPAEWRLLRDRLAWEYPFAAATRQPAKTSVSALRRRAAVADEEAAQIFDADLGGAAGEPRPPRPAKPDRAPRARIAGRTERLSSADIGTAHHKFLQLVDLEQVGSLESLKKEAARIEQIGALSSDEAALLDFAGLAAFWHSDLGRRLREQARFVARELPFTLGMSPREMAEFSGQDADPGLADERVVVQGVADLAVLLPKEIWLLDFKTDHLGPGDLKEKARLYGPQLKLYARALAKIYNRPVTKSWLFFLRPQEAVEVETV